MSNSLNDPFQDRKVLQLLLKRGLISSAQAKEIFENKFVLKQNLEKQRQKRQGDIVSANRIDNPVTIVDVITSLKLERADDITMELDEDIIFQTLSDEWKMPYKKIDPLKLDLNLVTTIIPRSFAMKHLIMPIDVADGRVTVATPNPFNLEAFDDVTRVSQLQVDAIVSSKTDVIKLISEFFGFKHSIAEAEHQQVGDGVDLGNLERYVKLMSADELPPTDQHIVNAVNHLLVHAFEQRASDIHIEPKRDISRVRIRIDGVLHTVYELPKQVHNAIVSRIKNMSGLDMAMKRKPQDGRIKTEKEGMAVEIRISTLPVTFGEKVVMRLMNPEMQMQDLSGIGFEPADLATFKTFIEQPHGIVLVTGPTGSGKSTTLYTALRALSTPDVNITTIEDPIEMVHEDFNQIAVNPAVNITFGTILKTILRQDPDIIMVGEMRDLATAENAVQASLTGHLVLSTLHTNDAPSSITRLVDLGVAPFLIQATLNGILAQRLLRKICAHCKESFEIKRSELSNMGLDVLQTVFVDKDVKMNMTDLAKVGLASQKTDSVILHRGKGCQKCRNTGYLGRVGIFEVLPYSLSLKQMTEEKMDLAALRDKARAEGMITLRENAVKKLLEGVTTYEEVLRVTWEQS
jgi:general secretion pathway protein E